MRILFTGGGSGGHFYPIISIVEALNTLVKEKKILPAELIFMSPDPYNKGVLFEHGIEYRKNTAGKLRRNPGILSIFKNIFDVFRMGWGVLTAVYQVFRLYPDVVFGKGAYGSFPALMAARLLHIPVVIHESDTVPGRVNKWAGKFATRIAVSYKDAAKFFPEGKVAYTGQPVRKDIAEPIISGAREFLKLEEETPVILILCGSQGSELINDAVLEGLKQLVNKYQIIHQTGRKNFAEAEATARAVLFDSPHAERYKPFDYLDSLALRMAAGVASVVISRAGSTIFEIAAWGVPSIIVPITHSNGDHQRRNAFAYARAGAAEVVEEANLSPNIIFSEVGRIISSPDESARMRAAAKAFYKPDSASLVAEEILKIALSHEIEK
ncbi:MAG: UDP-N-acetylglucosamine--N-acetylmuramyl-(pentapeptide) pyrophosphoryl-undecaprenol N-acetylglucosamine transferase [bacterium]